MYYPKVERLKPLKPKKTRKKKKSNIEKIKFGLDFGWCKNTIGRFEAKEKEKEKKEKKKKKKLCPHLHDRWGESYKCEIAIQIYIAPRGLNKKYQKGKKVAW